MVRNSRNRNTPLRLIHTVQLHPNIMHWMITYSKSIDDRPQPEAAPSTHMGKDAPRDDEDGEICAYRADDCWSTPFRAVT
jgi:hypothetical protein